MMIILNSLFIRAHRQAKHSSFSSLQSHMVELNLKSKKLTKHVNFEIRRKFYKKWLLETRAILREREEARAEFARLKAI